jgi:putative membrane protein insertion efficiency factor
MTKEFPMTKVPSATPTMTTGSSSGFRHALVISASSFVIRVLTLLIRGYQLTLSPAQTFLFGASSGCRFTPTCSVYAVDALREHGAVAGTVLATKRICRCHPWGGGGPDPVPGKKSGLTPHASRLTPVHF